MKKLWALVTWPLQLSVGFNNPKTSPCSAHVIVLNLVTLLQHHLSSTKL